MSDPRETLALALEGKGWRRDPDATRTVGYNDGQPDPNVWLHRRRAGGMWRLSLNYQVKGWRATYDNQLRSATLSFTEGDRKFLLEKPGKNDSPRLLWLATGRGADGKVWYTPSGARERSLRERVEVVATNPDLAAWVAAEIRAEALRAQAERNRANKLDREMRNRPLPVTISQKKQNSWDDSDWDRLVERACEAARKIKRADGKSDLRALVKDLIRVTNSIENVVIWDDTEQQPAAPRNVAAWNVRQLDLS